ncbi:MAG: hypothetical protein KGL39_57050 [Patescibacteria group bacterium]|nr:hypothetical protein [Patescibacteria group bacterium]
MIPDTPRPHVWVGQRSGGDPTEASSAEFVRYCQVCGSEDTGEEDFDLICDHICKCGHLESRHFETMDADGYPHDFEQFCLGNENRDDEEQCFCNHFEPAEASE